MLRGTAMASAFGLAAVLIVLLLGQWLLGTLFGPEFVAAYPVLLVLIGVPLLGMVSFPLTPMLYALDRPDAPLKARAVGTVVYLAIVAPLCWRFDTAGAASALVIGNAHHRRLDGGPAAQRIPQGPRPMSELRASGCCSAPAPATITRRWRWPRRSACRSRRGLSPTTRCRRSASGCRRRR